MKKRLNRRTTYRRILRGVKFKDSKIRSLEKKPTKLGTPSKFKRGTNIVTEENGV